MVLYHGTIKKYAIDILKNGIDLNKGTELCDFGKGFYTTPNKKFAIRRAKERSTVYNGIFNSKESLPAVVILEIDTEAIEKYLNIKILKLDNKWAGFVANNRQKHKSKINVKYDHNKDYKYDIVYGPTADGQLENVCNIFEEGNIPKDCYKKLINKNFKPQCSFHTKEAIKYIKHLKFFIIQ